jgi:ribosomal protein S27AE
MVTDSARFVVVLFSRRVSGANIRMTTGIPSDVCMLAEIITNSRTFHRLKIQDANPMTTPKETCPKCGAVVIRKLSTYTDFRCGSGNYNARFTQSNRCRITALEKENERLRGELERFNALPNNNDRTLLDPKEEKRNE